MAFFYFFDDFGFRNLVKFRNHFRRKTHATIEVYLFLAKNCYPRIVGNRPFCLEDFPWVYLDHEVFNPVGVLFPLLKSVFLAEVFGSQIEEKN